LCLIFMTAERTLVKPVQPIHDKNELFLICEILLEAKLKMKHMLKTFVGCAHSVSTSNGFGLIMPNLHQLKRTPCGPQKSGIQSILLVVLLCLGVVVLNWGLWF